MYQYIYPYKTLCSVNLLLKLITVKFKFLYYVFLPLDCWCSVIFFSYCYSWLL